ncbi:MAG: TraR/DksA C4-type zinc finger protein [bacterium]|nr:TraR/DksA C4-type zinc finger protein [bacterium]
MNDTALHQFKRTLLQKRAELEATMQSHRPTSMERCADPYDMAMANAEAETNLKIFKAARKSQFQVAAALDRIERGTYGICRNRHCSQEIPLKRLEAVPEAEHCVECQAHHEHSVSADYALALA